MGGGDVVFVDAFIYDFIPVIGKSLLPSTFCDQCNRVLIAALCYNLRHEKHSIYQYVRVVRGASFRFDGGYWRVW